MARQAVITRPAPAHLWMVLDEAALRRPVGGPVVMRSQLGHLMDMADRPNVSLQVFPLTTAGHTVARGAFTVLRFREPDLPDVVYLEQLTSALYLDKRDTVDHYMAVLERLCVEALPAEGSLKMISDLVDD